MTKLKTIVVMPAYNAEATLEKTISDIPFDYVEEIILVDDASRDDTVKLAKMIGEHHNRLSVRPEDVIRDAKKVLLHVERIEKNVGYGGNQKKCYRLALDHGADIVVMLHPDYQYDPKLIKYFVEFIENGYFDVMLGTRIRSRREALAGGMPLYKYYANRMLSFIQNTASGLVLSEWHTGMRAYKRQVLQNIGFEKFSNDFVFDTQAMFAIIKKGYSIGDIPVPVRYFREASSINFVRSCRYGILTVWETSKCLITKSKQICTYVTVGIIGVVTNIGLYSLMIYQLHLWYIAAAAIAFCCGATVSFTLQKFWTFKQMSSNRVSSEIVMYLLLAVVNICINSFILYILVHNMILGKFFANIISNGVVAIWSYYIYKHVVFTDKSKSATISKLFAYVRN